MKIRLWLVLIGLFFLVPGNAGAVSYEFEDMIDTWGPLQLDAAYVPQYPGVLEYTHDINDDVDFESGDLVTEARLELDFTNDMTDDSGSVLFGLIQ